MSDEIAAYNEAARKGTSGGIAHWPEVWVITPELRWRALDNGNQALEQAWRSLDNRLDWRLVPTVIA